MRQTILIVIGFLMTTLCSAQIVKDGEYFTDVVTVDDKVVFIKEINLTKNDPSNYSKLRDWAKENFGKDPFISSVRYDAKNNEIIAKSRIELLLPPNSKNVREKVVMRYRLNAFLFGDKCILEVKGISFMVDSAKKGGHGVTRAEDIIVDATLKESDPLYELKKNTQKSTIYFFNELVKELEVAIK